jgi:hypothetical protein
MMSEERSANDLNVNVIQQAYMTNKVLSVVDNDIETGSNSSSEKAVLKGILKKSRDEDAETRTGLMIIKLFTTLICEMAPSNTE